MKLSERELMFDDEARGIANNEISQFLQKYEKGETDFPPAEALSFACGVLSIMASPKEIKNKSGLQLMDMLDNSKGVSYSKVFPLMQAFHLEINQEIDSARIKAAAPLPAGDVPF